MTLILVGDGRKDIARRVFVSDGILKAFAITNTARRSKTAFIINWRMFLNHNELNTGDYLLQVVDGLSVVKWWRMSPYEPVWIRLLHNLQYLCNVTRHWGYISVQQWPTCWLHSYYWLGLLMLWLIQSSSRVGPDSLQSTYEVICNNMYLIGLIIGLSKEKIF